MNSGKKPTRNKVTKRSSSISLATNNMHNTQEYLPGAATPTNAQANSSSFVDKKMTKFEQ
jgi:hypothetical protein